MTVKTFILVGGKGERLRPLTDVRPKPDVDLASKPILEYDIDILVNAGYYDLNLAIQYRSRNIVDYFGDGSQFVYHNGSESRPLAIKYAEPAADDRFVGTADALRKSRIYLADGVVVRDIHTQEEREISVDEYLQRHSSYILQSYIEKFNHIIVCSGDILTNFDLEKLVEFHKERGGIATIAMYRTSPERIVNNFGIMKTDEQGRILKFTEKPKSVEEVDSDLINAGIYVFSREILDELERHKHWYDFGKHVFPELRSMYPQDVNGLELNGYWDDVGTIESYRETNIRLIDGIDGINIFSRKERPQENTRIRGKAVHSLVAQGCEIENEAYAEDCVIGNNVHIKSGARLKRCILLPHSIIHRNIEAEDCIFDRNVEVYEGSRIGKGAVIGSDTIIESGAIIWPGVRIGPGQVIKDEIKEDILEER